MNKVKKLTESVKLNKSTKLSEGYSAINFMESSNKYLHDLIEDIKPISKSYEMPSTGLHTTIMYSPDTPVPLRLEELDGVTLELINPKFSWFGEDKNCLVIEFTSPILNEMNNRLLAGGEIPSALSADYKPHITLFKTIELKEGAELPLLPPTIMITINESYSEEVK